MTSYKHFLFITKKLFRIVSLTKKVEVKLNLVSKAEDKAAGGWSKSNKYCSRQRKVF